jgi:hypothetical protein
MRGVANVYLYRYAFPDAEGRKGEPSFVQLPPEVA